MKDYFTEHISDLSLRAQTRNVYTFSEFLSPDEQSRLLSEKRRLGPFTLFGGADGAERMMARFGDETPPENGEPFPIACVHITPKNPRFAEALTHRDVLGTLMSLGMERAEFGDIVVRENGIYVFCTERAAGVLINEVSRIRRTDVRAEVSDTPPQGELFRTQPKRAIVSSLRIDCVCCAAANLSRNRLNESMREKKVFLNGAVCEKPDAVLCPGDTVSLRGFGKFRLKDVAGQSKKGRVILELEVYV